MGFVNSKDLVKWLEDESSLVRELCGKCVFLRHLNEIKGDNHELPIMGR